MEENFYEVIENIRNILNQKNGIITDDFLRIANETKEEFIRKEKLTFEQSMNIDRIFDEFIENLNR